MTRAHEGSPALVERGDDPPLTADERAAVRAYLQRSEVRLSTMHRIATALLSGAGLMVLLPAVERDSVVAVIRALLDADRDVASTALVVGIAASLLLPSCALWLVLRELTRFYFHANHLHRAGGDTFVPRFTLTGLALPRGELEPEAAAQLDDQRRAPNVLELLVPTNPAARERIDQRVAAYRGGTPSTDAERADALFDIAASRPRSLLEEVAKVEFGMVRHVLRIQSVVLRYVKALLALLTTALAAFAGAAVVEGKAALAPGDELWLAAILVIWAPVVVLAVAAPVDWLEKELRREATDHTAVSDDRDLTAVEDVAVRLALVGFLAAAVAIVAVLPADDLSQGARNAGIAVLVAGTVAFAAVLVRWTGRHGIRRLVHRG